MSGIQAKSTPCYDFEWRVAQTYTCICLYSSFRIPFGFPGFDFFYLNFNVLKRYTVKLSACWPRLIHKPLDMPFPNTPYQLLCCLFSLASPATGVVSPLKDIPDLGKDYLMSGCQRCQWEEIEKLIRRSWLGNGKDWKRMKVSPKCNGDISTVYRCLWHLNGGCSGAANDCTVEDGSAVPQPRATSQYVYTKE